MHKHVLAADPLRFLPPRAQANDSYQFQGTVETVNPAAGTLTLKSGQSFQFANGTVLYGLLPGQEVGVTANGTQGIGAFDPHPANRDGDVN